MIRPALVLLLLCGAVGAAQQPRVVPVDRVDVIVDKQPILYSELVEAMAILGDKQGLVAFPDTASPEFKALRELARQQLIDNEVLVQEAKAAKIAIPEEDIARDVNAYIERLRTDAGGDSGFVSKLRDAGFASVESFRGFQLELARRQRLTQELFKAASRDGRISGAPVSEKDIDEALRNVTAEQRQRPVTVSFAQLVLPTKPSDAATAVARAKADSLLVRLQAGADFEQMAKRESMDEGTAAGGGDIGWHRRGDGLVPEFEYWLFQLAPNALSPVFQTRFGFHILRVDQKQSAADVRSRHILIRPTIDSADYRRTLALADSIARAARAGTSFDSLIARFHDPIESRSVPDFVRDSLPDAYKAALEGLKVNDVTAPFPLGAAVGQFPSFAILKVEKINETGVRTDTELRQVIRARLSQQAGLRRYLDKLRDARYIQIIPP